MNALMETEKQTIKNSFEGFADDYWKTLGEISAASKIKMEDVVRIVFTSGDFVRSSRRQKEGEPVFTSLDVYRKRATFFEKLRGAFRNRID